MKRPLAQQLTRVNSRYKPNSDLLVVKTLNQDVQPYPVIDLGTGGLAFRYLGKKLPLNKFDKISLFHGEDLILDSILVHPVSDDLLRGNLVPVRRRSVQFISLNSEQQRTLESYLRECEESPD